MKSILRGLPLWPIFIALFTSMPVLAQGIPCLTGIVTDASGAPVVGGDLDFDYAPTGQRLVTPGDNTGVGGFYGVCILPAGFYHVSFEPPPFSRLVGKRFRNIDLRSSLELNVTLDFGTVISGVVSDTLGFPVANVDMDADSIGGGRAFTPGDKTDLITGAYRVVLPQAHYRFRYDPLPGVRLRGIQIDSVNVANDTIINVSLLSGQFVTGVVTDQFGLSLDRVNIGFRDTLTGVKLYVSNDKTSVLGAYAVVVPPGVYVMQFAPPPGSRLLGAQINRAAINVDTVINQSLGSGILVTVVVNDIDGNPIPGVDLDLTLESTRIRQYTPNDNTDADGSATVVVAPDIYEIKADPPPGSILDRTVIRNVSIQGDTTITLVLKIQKFNLLGQVVNSSGAGLASIDIRAQAQSGTDLVTVKTDSTDSTGIFSFGVPINATDILISARRGGRYVSRIFNNIAIRSDTIWSSIALDTGVVLHAFVVDEFFSPAWEYRLALKDNLTGLVIPSPYDTVDRFGLVDVTAPIGDYSLSVNTPAPILSASLTIAGFNLISDTSIILDLSQSSSFLPGAFSLKQNYPNPFNGGTKIPYLLLKDTEIEINIYNALGQKVRQVANGTFPAGYYEAIWEGDNDDGRPVASGVYFYSLKVPQTPQSTVSRTMLIIR